MKSDPKVLKQLRDLKNELKEIKKEVPKQQAQKPMAAPKQVEQHPTAPKSQ